MHGRRKADHLAALQNEAEQEVIRTKVKKYQQLAALALHKREEETGRRRRRQENDGGGDAADAAASSSSSLEDLQLSAQLLRVNPDVYTLWNHRKEVIGATHVLQRLGVGEEEQDGSESAAAAAGSGTESSSSSSSSSGKAFFDTELGLVAECIQKNPKSYGAWHHRRWLLEQAFPVTSSSSSTSTSTNTNSVLLVPTLDRELALCSRFLDLDERNFHCWNHRRFVADKHPIHTAADEFAFSTARIYKNFSNYSAFHHRASYLPGYLAETHKAPQQLVREELEMVQQAIFTEPDDQTAWWYHQYLIALAEEHADADTGGGGGGNSAKKEGASSSFLEEVLSKEIEAIRSLVEEGDEEVVGGGGGGGGYRWAVLTLASLVQKLAGVKEKEEGEGDNHEGESAALKAESRALFERLRTMDPDHAARYQHILDSSSL